MDTYVVGDLHGQLEIAMKAIRIGAPVIFLGDYLDSHRVGIEDQVRTLQYVLDAVKDGQARALFGNHERSYIDDHMMCSGFKHATLAHVMHLDWSPLEHYIEAEGFLMTHAGVSAKLLDVTGSTVAEYLEAGSYDQIGRSRGGSQVSGGLYWCDWNRDFVPVDGTKQIVGHTRGDIIREKDGNFCIDVLEDSFSQIVRINDGGLVTVRL